MTHPLLTEFRRVLDLEERGGFRDRAAFGGLAAYSLAWRRRAAEDSVGPAIPARTLDAIDRALTGYGAAGSADRAARIARLRAVLSDPPVAAAPPKPANPTPSAAVEAADAVAVAGRARSTRTESPKPSAPRPARPDSPESSVPRPARARTAKGSTLRPEQDVTAVPGLGRPTAIKLARLGVTTVEDLLYLLPRRYLDFSQRVRIADLRPGVDQTVFVTVWESRVKPFGARLSGTEAVLADETGNLRAVWFGNKYLAKQLPAGTRLAVSGRPSVYGGRLTMQSPEYEVIEGDDALTHAGRLVPVHPATEGLHTRTLRQAIRAALPAAAYLADPLPAPLRHAHRLLDLAAALEAIHFPNSAAAADAGRRRLAFDELLTLQLAVLARRRAWVAGQRGEAIVGPPGELERMLAALPFQLTGAQGRALAAILDDLGRATPMSRLLQGDVGSGKTVVAAIALYLAVRAGCQGALMAPTEILAEQHYRTLSRLIEAFEGETPAGPLFGATGTRTALLTGSLTRTQRTRVYQQLAAGEIDLVVGTHAIIQEGVDFARLGLVVIDEQHRFGVEQRALLRGKGRNPHLLVMTATPIPRTLALTLYGDLDVTVIDELPPGRQKIVTRQLRPDQRPRAYQFIRDQIEQGRQAFIICPLVEESEQLAVKAAVQEFEQLQAEVFPDISIGLIHGRLRNGEKDQVMRAFRDAETKILVATSVIEVGIDVPNATILLIEGADRFGLSQLHQFRGRVGRGTAESYCLLLADTPSADSRERLAILEQTSDGFRLAEEDLRLRGPGEFFGTRQSGLPDLRAARLTDTALLEEARAVAGRLLDADPDLRQPDHAALAARVAALSRWSPAAAG